MAFIFILVNATMAFTGLFISCAFVQILIKLLQNRYGIDADADGDADSDGDSDADAGADADIDRRVERMNALYSELAQDRARLQRAKVD
jgi:hypothetical protein